MFENEEHQREMVGEYTELEQKESKIREQYDELYEHVKSMYPECLV
jgi:hypothetical protein